MVTNSFTKQTFLLSLLLWLFVGYLAVKEVTSLNTLQEILASDLLYLIIGIATA